MMNKLTSRFPILPQHCLLCEQMSQRAICNYCQQAMPFYSHRGNLLERPDINKLFAKREFNLLRAMMPYESPLSTLITQMKFHSNTTAARAMATLFIEHIDQISLPQCALMMPVPLHGIRYIQRKYNQSDLIARQLAKHWHITYRPRIAERIKLTQPQSKMTAQARKQNVKAAFRVKQEVESDHIILFDDVITTGATVNQLARTLKTSRPHITVEVWCLCITHLR